METIRNTFAALTAVTEEGHDVAGAIVIGVLCLICLLVWAASEGLLSRARRREQDRDALAEGLGVVRDTNPYMRPWRDRRPGDLGGGAA